MAESNSKQDVEILLVGSKGVGICALTNTIVGQLISPELGYDQHLQQERKALSRGLEVTYSDVNFTNWYPDLCDDDYLFRTKANTCDLILYCASLNLVSRSLKKIPCFLSEDWKKTVFVLTFANYFDQEENEVYLRACRSVLYDTLRSTGVDEDTIDAIPIVPAGYDPDDPLPGCENWLSRLWYACLFRMNKKAQSAFLKASFNFDAKIVAGIKLEALPARLAAEFKDTIQQKQTAIDSEMLFDKAMEYGYVVCRSIVLLQVGAGGAGKTSFKHLLLNLPLPDARESTPLAESAIRAISVSRATVADSGLDWQAVTPSQLESVLAGGIKGNVILIQSSVGPELLRRNVSRYDDIELSEEKIGESKTKVTPPKVLVSSSSSLQRDHVATFALKLRQEYLTLLKKSPVSTKLLEVDWIYIIDSGGQPQYHELLSTAVKHISGAVLFLKLNEELDSRPTVEYYAKGGRCIGEPYVSALTHKEIINSCLQVIQSRQGISEDDSLKLFVVGTHQDREAECTETCEDKNQWFMDKCLPHDMFQKQLICYRSGTPDEVIFPVNARKPSKTDHAVVESFRNAVTSNCSKTKIKIPIAWFMLERLLEMLSETKGSKILPLIECVEQGRSLKMKRRDVIGAINYLTKHNVFMYFPDELPNIVFSSSQVILDKLSELVEHSHVLRGRSAVRVTTGSNSESRDFRDRGIVSIQLLQQFPKHYVPGLFSAEDLLQLLEVLLIIAKFASGPSVMYFMPSVLPTKDMLAHGFPISGDSDLSPMLVYYPGGWLPYGFFSALVVYLLNTSRWKVCENHGKPECLYKNCVMFKLPNKGTAILADSLSHLEVQVQLRDWKDCHYVRTEIFQGLAKVAEIKNYVDLAAPEIGFVCQGPQKSPHIGHDATRHLAMVESNNIWWTCSLQDRVCGKLTSKQLPWLKDDAESVKAVGSQFCSATDATDGLSAMLAQKTLAAVGTLSLQQTASASLYGMKPNTKDLNVIRWSHPSGEVRSYRLCENVSYQWKTLGQILGFSEGFLKGVAISNRDRPGDCWSDVVGRWLEEGSESVAAYPSSWQGLIAALEDVGGCRLEITRLCKALENRVRYNVQQEHGVRTMYSIDD